MAHWVKIHYERQEYIVDLDQISAFVSSPNGRVTFWLPESAIPIILTKQGNPEDYHKLVDYVNERKNQSLSGSWMKFLYDRSYYYVDMNRVSSFCYTPNNKLTFWLPDAAIPVILTKQGDTEGYNQLREFIICRTGKSLP